LERVHWDARKREYTLEHQRHHRDEYQGTPEFVRQNAIKLSLRSLLDLQSQFVTARWIEETLK